MKKALIYRGTTMASDLCFEFFPRWSEIMDLVTSGNQIKIDDAARQLEDKERALENFLKRKVCNAGGGGTPSVSWRSGIGDGGIEIEGGDFDVLTFDAPVGGDLVMMWWWIRAETGFATGPGAALVGWRVDDVPQGGSEMTYGTSIEYPWTSVTDNVVFSCGGVFHPVNNGSSVALQINNLTLDPYFYDYQAVAMAVTFIS